MLEKPQKNFSDVDSVARACYDFSKECGNFQQIRTFASLYLRDGYMKEKLERYIDRLRQGDGRAFDYVYEHTHRRVYFTALYFMKDKMLAEDVMQETYVRALSALGQYRQGTDIAAWLNAIARSIALTKLRNAGREVASDFSADERAFGTHETELPFIFDLAAKVLSEDEYEIVMLCNVAGYRRREVAEMTGMPIGTVTWKNNEALKKLKKHLEAEGSL